VHERLCQKRCFNKANAIKFSLASHLCLQVESRLLCVNRWSSELGKSVLQQLSSLYRALVWEGFILLAVAAEEDRTTVQPTSVADESAKQADPQPVTVVVTPTATPSLGTEGNSNSTSMQMEIEVIRTPPTPTSGTAVPILLPTQSIQPSNSSATEGGQSASPQVVAPPTSNTHVQPSILVESLKHLTPLLTITSRVGRSLAELMSLLVRLSTSPLHRSHRRGAGHALMAHGFFDTSQEAMDVCLEITNLLADSLCWEVPMPHACSSAMESPIRDWLFAG